MHMWIAVGLGAGALVVGLASLVAWRRAGRTNVEVAHPEPPSALRVLHGDDELTDALRRAARNEWVTASRFQRHVERYEAEIDSSPVAHHPAHLRPVATRRPDPHTRSA